jgi:ribosome-associated protein
VLGARCQLLSTTTSLSNEERARAYMERHGMGRHSADAAPDPVAKSREDGVPESKLPGRRLPQVRGAAPSSEEICDLLKNEGGGLDVVDIDVSSKASFTNNLIVCTGRSPAHLKDLADRLVRKLRDCSVTVDGDIAGVAAGRSPDWVVVDAGLSVAHILLEDTRAKYSLEELWLPDDATERQDLEST